MTTNFENTYQAFMHCDVDKLAAEFAAMYHSGGEERVEDGWMFHEKDPITGEDKTSFRPDFTDEEKAIMDAHAKAAEKHATTNKTNPYKKKTGPNK